MGKEFIFQDQGAAVANKWSDDERRYLLKQAPTEYVEDLAVALDRTTKAVTSMAHRMGVSFKSKPKGNT